MRVVVSLTTIPGRVNLLQRTLASLQRQTCPPDAIYLWLPEPLFAGGPSTLPSMDGVIATSGPDPGPAMKLLPVLDRELDPETCVITVDDDIEYPPGLVERFIAASILLPDHALGFTGWNRVDSPAGPEVWHFNEEVPHAAMFQPVQVLEGYRGVIYRRRFFTHDIHRHLAAEPAFRFHDDILLSGYLASRGIARTVCWYTTYPPPPGSHWQLHGDAIGLHTRPAWLAEAWQAWDYWNHCKPGIFSSPPLLNRTERLQLLVDSQARPGFLHHCRKGGTTCDHTFDLAYQPWPWPDAQFRELLLLDTWPDRKEDALQWLQEAWRILQEGGIFRLRLPSNLTQSHADARNQGGNLTPPFVGVSAISPFKPPSYSPSPPSLYPGWLSTWHQDGDSKVGTFLKTQKPT